jgi:hypothetical protein
MEINIAADNLIIWVGLGAGVLVIARWLTIKDPLKILTKPLGPVNYDFNESWASTLTEVGAILGTILATSDVLPKEGFDKATFAGLNLLFGALLLIAPFLFKTLSKRKIVQVDDGTGTGATRDAIQYQGYVVSFLVATAIILWAVVGELFTMGLLLGELLTGKAHTVPNFIGVIFGIATLLIIIHALRSIGDTLQVQVEDVKSDWFIERVEDEALPAWKML